MAGIAPPSEDIGAIVNNQEVRYGRQRFDGQRLRLDGIQTSTSPDPLRPYPEAPRATE
jgi:hypothetical protein